MADLSRAQQLYERTYGKTAEQTDEQKEEDQKTPAQLLYERTYGKPTTDVKGNTFYNPEIPEESV